MRNENATVFKLALDEDQYVGCTKSLKHFYSCRDIVAQGVVYWLKMIWNGPVELTVYERGSTGEWNLTLFENLRNGSVDLLPAEKVPGAEHFLNYAVITASDFNQYRFYTKYPSIAENGFKFLLNPFSFSLWLITISMFVSFAFLFLLQKRFSFNNSPYLLNLFKVITVCVSFLLCVYASKLKAMLNTPDSQIPFHNVEELADKIERGQMKLYLEEYHTKRYTVLTNETLDKPDSFKVLTKALQRADGLRVVKDVHELCKLTASRSDVVFFAYDNLIDLQCFQFCFWKYEITELPLVPTSFMMYKKSIFVENATLFAYAIQNFRSNLQKMTNPYVKCAQDVKFDAKSNYIGSNSLSILFYLYLLSTHNTQFSGQKVECLIIVENWSNNKNRTERHFNRIQFGRNVTELLDALLDDYDKDIRPDLEEGFPTQVNINILVRSMGPISEKDMCYSMDCYFRQNWQDNRLKFRSDTQEALTLGASMLDKIWKPDTYFWNGQDSYLHKLTVPNRFIRLKQDGNVQYSTRLTIKAKCPMYLQNFPLDGQRCPLHIGSFAYQTKDVVYVWSKGLNESVTTAEKNLEMSQYVLKEIIVGFENISRESKEGVFSTLTVHFHLDRHIGYFLINFYAPCTLIVILSWVAFWINREATADRIGLGATSILTMTFMAQDSKQDLPKVTYATALDVYMVLCYAFVLGTIAEFSLVHAFTKYNSGDPELRYLEKERVEEVKRASITKDKMFLEKNGGIYKVRCSYTTYPPVDVMPRLKKVNDANREAKTDGICCKNAYNQWVDHGRKSDPLNLDVNSTSNIDRIARMLFPFSFAFISILYWYTYWRNDK